MTTGTGELTRTVRCSDCLKRAGSRRHEYESYHTGSEENDEHQVATGSEGVR